MGRTTTRDPHVYPLATTTSIDEAKRWLKRVVHEGARCPCCGQFARVYKRKLLPDLAAILIFIYREALQHPDQEWIHVPTLLSRDARVSRMGGEYARASLWGLIQAKPGEAADAESSGYYKLSDRGVAFVDCNLTVSEYVWVYNGTRIDEEGRMLTIRDILGLKYSYEELMS